MPGSVSLVILLAPISLFLPVASNVEEERSEIEAELVESSTADSLPTLEEFPATDPPAHAAEVPSPAGRKGGPPPGMGGSGPAALLTSPVVGQLSSSAQYQAIWLPSADVSGQPTDLAMLQQDITALSPIRQSETDEWSLFTNIRAETFDTGAILPTTRQPFPTDLWNIRLGTTYRHRFANDWIGGAMVTIGSASDEPFHGIAEMTLGASVFARVPQGERNSWLFSLNYFTNSQVLYGIPLPGVAYTFVPSDRFQATLGLPFTMVMARPADRWMIMMTYGVLTTVQARIVYQPIGPLRFYVGYAWDNENYFRVDRITIDQRLYYYDMRLTAGVVAPLGRRAMLDLSGGYVFDRYYFEGEQGFRDQNFNRVDLANTALVGLRAELRF